MPPPLAEPVAALRQLIDWHPPAATQTALAGFINDGLLDKHIRRGRRTYTRGPLSASAVKHARSRGVPGYALALNFPRQP